MPTRSGPSSCWRSTASSSTASRSTASATTSTTSSLQAVRQSWARIADRTSKAFGLVLLLVIGTYVLGSVSSYRGWSGVVIAVWCALTACVALATAGAKRVTVHCAVAISAIAIGFAIVSAAVDEDGLIGVSALLQAGVLLVAAAVVLRTVMLEHEVGFRTILGAISVYIMIALLFAFLYVGIERVQSGPFFGSVDTESGDFLFFSLTTLTTTGYGNLVPVEQPGKMFAGIEMLLGQIFLVTLIAGLVSHWRPGRALRASVDQRLEPDQETADRAHGGGVHGRATDA